MSRFEFKLLCKQCQNNEPCSIDEYKIMEDFKFSRKSIKKTPNNNLHCFVANIKHKSEKDAEQLAKKILQTNDNLAHVTVEKKFISFL